MRVGLIGYGEIGKVHAAVWSNMPGVKLIAIADQIAERRAEASQKHSCKVYESDFEMLQNEALDICVVATPLPDHYPSSLAALLKDCHVICEKPFMLALGEADAILETAAKRKRLLAVNHQNIFTTAVEDIQRMLQKGAIGKLCLIETWGKGRLACYELLEDAVHGLHLMRHFAESEVTEVFGDIQQEGRAVQREDIRPLHELYLKGRVSGHGAGDWIFGYYRFANGCRGVLRLATLKEPSSDYSAVLLSGTKGRLRLHYSKYHSPEGRLFYSPFPCDNLSPNSWEEIEVNPPDYKKKTPYAEVSMRRLAEDFLAAIKEQRPPRVSGEDGRMALEMALGLYISHFKQSWISLPLEVRMWSLA